MEFVRAREQVGAPVLSAALELVEYVLWLYTCCPNGQVDLYSVFDM